MKEVKYYEAFNGLRFENEDKCREYERKAIINSQLKNIKYFVKNDTDRAVEVDLLTIVKTNIPIERIEKIVIHNPYEFHDFVILFCDAYDLRNPFNAIDSHGTWERNYALNGRFVRVPGENDHWELFDLENLTSVTSSKEESK